MDMDEEPGRCEHGETFLNGVRGVPFPDEDINRYLGKVVDARVMLEIQRLIDERYPGHRISITGRDVEMEPIEVGGRRLFKFRKAIIYEVLDHGVFARGELIEPPIAVQRGLSRGVRMPEDALDLLREATRLFFQVGERLERGIEKGLLEDILVLLYPTRYEIYVTLKDAGEPLNASQISEKLGLCRKLISRHLSKLEEGGFVTSTLRVQKTPRGPRRRVRYYKLTYKADRILREFKEKLKS